MDILSGIYPFFYLLSLLGLIGWFYFRGSNYSGLMSKMFLFSFFIYLVSLAFSPATLGFKLIILSRDFILMSLIVIGFQFLTKIKVLYFGALGVFLAIFFSVLFDYWKDTFNFFKPELATDQPQLIVHLKNDFSESSLALIKRRFDFNCRPLSIPEEASVFFSGTIICQIPQASLLKKDQIVWLLNRHPGINHWEWNEQVSLIKPPQKGPQMEDIISPDLAAGDPFNLRMWHHQQLEYNHIHQLLADGTEPIQQQIIIAILDTGIDNLHEDLHHSFISFGDQHDGDPMGHGTHCAGIAAAVSNNQIGISSLAPAGDHYRVTSVRVLNKNGFGSKKNIAKGIIEAADKGAGVISLSLGGPSSTSEKLYERAVKYANSKNAIVLAAAGNAGSPSRGFSPANVKGVITVGAINQQLQLTSFSNTPEGVDLYIAAPGMDIFSTLPGNRYEYFSGTSMATPLTASIVAILKSYRPELSTTEIYQILYQSGSPVGGWEEVQSISPLNAIKYLLNE